MRGEVVSQDEGVAAVTIVIAPSEEEAQQYAKTVLEPYYKGHPQCINFSHIQPIFLSPITKTIFLYTLEDGQISEQKPEKLPGFCKIANEPGGCIYYPCCKSSNRSENCQSNYCMDCDNRRCKPNPGGKTISIDNVPCGYDMGGDDCD